MLSEPDQWPGESKHLVVHYERRTSLFRLHQQSSSRRVLYIGVTGDIEKRVFEHKTGKTGGFSSQYNAHRLVYFERFGDIHAAIAREKQLKGWGRAKKEALIRAMNPAWEDLSEAWFQTARSFDSPPNPGAARSG